MGADVDADRARRLAAAEVMAAAIDYDDEERELGPDETMIMLRVVGPGAADACLEDVVEDYLRTLGFVVAGDG